MMKKFSLFLLITASSFFCKAQTNVAAQKWVNDTYKKLVTTSALRS